MILTPPCARPMAIIAAASITHDRGFHIKPKNFKILLSYSNYSINRKDQDMKNRKIKITEKRKQVSGGATLTFFSSSLLYPNNSNLFWTSSVLKPSCVHLRHLKTSSRGTFSCKEIAILSKKIKRHKNEKAGKETLYFQDIAFLANFCLLI